MLFNDLTDNLKADLLGTDPSSSREISPIHTCSIECASPLA